MNTNSSSADDAIHRGTILVVDDSPMIRHAIRSQFDGSTYRILEASNGHEALDTVCHVPDISLITLDMEMPGMQGLDLLAEMRKPNVAATLRAVNNCDIPVILVTANDTLEDRLKGYELGATNFMLKSQARLNLKDVADAILNPSGEFKNLGVLVVDDSAMARTVMGSCLRNLGVTIFEADDGYSGWDILNENQGAIDLVLTDIFMRNMNGDELCRKIRQVREYDDLPVILLSGTSDEKIALELFRAGATDYLRKPFIKEEFTARLEAHLKRRKTNKLLRKSVLELKRLNKMKDEFLSVCSHDLRTPLNGILGFSDLLLQDNKLDGDQYEMIEQIQTSGTYLLELVNDILDLGRTQSRKENLQFCETVISGVVQQCLDTVRPSTEKKRIALSLENALPGARVMGNRNALVRIMNNLLSNAVKFTPVEGRIAVQISRAADNMLDVAVTDSGIGIPQDMIPHLFEHYTKASRKGTDGEQSTGLGLMITKELIEAHQGRIDVQSAEGDGSTFCLSLPLLLSSDLEVAPEPERDVPVEPIEEDAVPMRILLAEDNLVNIKLAEKILERLGHRFDVAKNGALAVELFERSLTHQSYDLILMDIQMPEMDGLEAARAIRGLEKGDDHVAGSTPIVAMTAHRSEEMRQECLQAGMDDVMTKPFSQPSLAAVLSAFAVSSDKT